MSLSKAEDRFIYCLWDKNNVSLWCKDWDNLLAVSLWKIEVSPTLDSPVVRQTRCMFRTTCSHLHLTPEDLVGARGRSTSANVRLILLAVPWVKKSFVSNPSGCAFCQWPWNCRLMFSFQTVWKLLVSKWSKTPSWLLTQNLIKIRYTKL